MEVSIFGKLFYMEAKVSRSSRYTASNYNYHRLYCASWFIISSCICISTMHQNHRKRCVYDVWSETANKLKSNKLDSKILSLYYMYGRSLWYQLYLDDFFDDRVVGRRVAPWRRYEVYAHVPERIVAVPDYAVKYHLPNALSSLVFRAVAIESDGRHLGLLRAAARCFIARLEKFCNCPYKEVNS